MIKGSYSYSSDLWSFGVIVYTLLSGLSPFAQSKIAKRQNIANCAWKFPSNVIMSKEARDLISKILVPEARPTLEEVKMHPFFTKNHFPDSLTVQSLISKPTDQYLRKFIPEFHVEIPFLRDRMKSYLHSKLQSP